MLVFALLALTASGGRPALAVVTYGTLLSYDFDTNTWTGAATEAVGTIDTAGSTTASLGVRASSLVASGPQAINITETNLGKLTFAFSLSASAARPVTVTIESYDAGKNRTGGLTKLIFPAAPDFYQRYALDLSTMTPSGAGTFVPNAPYVSFSFSIGGTPWSGVSSPEIRVDNINYALPAYYVRPTTEGGSNSNSGRSESTAFATPQQALNAAQPGDIVDVMAGTYTGGPATTGTPAQTTDYGTSVVASFKRAGTPAKWIVLKNYPGQQPTFICNAYNIINIAEVNYDPSIPLAYLEVRGLHVLGQGQNPPLSKYASLVTTPSQTTPYPQTNTNGISINSSGMTYVPHHIRLADNFVEYCPAGGIGGSGDWITIEGNVCSNNCFTTGFGTSGISVSGTDNYDGTSGTYRRLIRNNTCYGNQTYQLYEYTSPTHYLHYSDGNGIIMDVNFVAGGAAFTGRTLVQGNLTFNNGGAGVHAYRASYVDIINNTAYMNSASVNLQYSEVDATAGDDCRIYNNILVAPTANTGAGEASESVNSNYAATNLTLSHNLYYGGNATPSKGNTDVANVIANPLFVNPSIDPAVANFHLQAASPARATGIAQTFSPYLDLDGNVRAGTPDKGVYQLTVSAAALTSSLNPSVAGGPAITLTATVAGSSPTGTVTFKDGSTTLGTGTLTNGITTFSTSSLSAGSHSLTAVYGGDNGNTSSTSAVLTQTVTLPSLSGTITLPNRTDMTSAQTFTLTPTGTTAGAVITQTLTIGSTGAFTLSNVPVGTYTLGVKGNQWLQKDTAVTTMSGSVTGLAITLLAGDLNGDNQVAGADLAMVRAAFGTTSSMGSWNPVCDLNGDGTITTADMAMVRVNFGRLGDP